MEIKEDINKDLDQKSKNFKFIEKVLIGREYHKSFLLFKYQLLNDSLVLIKMPQNISKEKFVQFLKLKIFL